MDGLISGFGYLYLVKQLYIEQNKDIRKLIQLYLAINNFTDHCTFILRNFPPDMHVLMFFIANRFCIGLLGLGSLPVVGSYTAIVPICQTLFKNTTHMKLKMPLSCILFK